MDNNKSRARAERRGGLSVLFLCVREEECAVCRRAGEARGDVCACVPWGGKGVLSRGDNRGSGVGGMR